MIRVCNYNLSHKENKLMGEKPPFNRSDKTHGICDECSVIFEAEAEKERRKINDEE